MLVNLCKWPSRHMKIAKSGYRVAAETIPFRRRWRGCMISVNLEAIWGMSVYGIAYRTAPSEKEIEAADIAASARHFTVLVECWQ